jgi:hypothetical protein
MPRDDARRLPERDVGERQHACGAVRCVGREKLLPLTLTSALRERRWRA